MIAQFVLYFPPVYVEICVCVYVCVWIILLNGTKLLSFKKGLKKFIQFMFPDYTFNLLLKLKTFLPHTNRAHSTFHFSFSAFYFWLNTQTHEHFYRLEFNIIWIQFENENMNWMCFGIISTTTPASNSPTFYLVYFGVHFHYYPAWWFMYCHTFSVRSSSSSSFFNEL